MDVGKGEIQSLRAEQRDTLAPMGVNRQEGTEQTGTGRGSVTLTLSGTVVFRRTREGDMSSGVFLCLGLCLSLSLCF